MPRRSHSRRSFLKQSSGLLLTVPAILAPGRSLFAGVSPNERIHTAHIGVGSRGTNRMEKCVAHPEAEVVGVCDVDMEHLHRAHRQVWKQARATADYRRLLDANDVDAVVITTPDHHHAEMTIAACEAKKDVYCEKPLCTFLEEGRRMVTAVKEHKRVVQVGTHHRSHPTMREIVEIVRSGRIGRVHSVKCWMWTNPFKDANAPTGVTPTHLDYQAWLGSAPFVPYHVDRIHFNFRWCRDYAGGYMTDWGAHMLNVVTHAMNVDYQGPVSVVASGGYKVGNLYDFPMSMRATWEFKNPDFRLSWIQPEEGGDVASGQKYGMTFYGEAGELRTYFHGYEFVVDGKKAPVPTGGNGFRLPRVPRDHIQNWLDSIRSRQLPVADIEAAHRTTSLCQLGNIALDSGRPLRWDGEHERFIDDREASRLLARDGVAVGD